jgi:hypothetical protein
MQLTDTLSVNLIHDMCNIYRRIAESLKQSTRCNGFNSATFILYNDYFAQ